MLLKESAQTNLNGEDVGCANLGVRDYETAEGVEREGLTARLALAGENWVVVGEGSVFHAGGKQWRVLAVKEGDPWGTVEVAPVESAGD